MDCWTFRILEYNAIKNIPHIVCSFWLQFFLPNIPSSHSKRTNLNSRCYSRIEKGGELNFCKTLNLRPKKLFILLIKFAHFFLSYFVLQFYQFELRVIIIQFLFLYLLQIRICTDNYKIRFVLYHYLE